MDGAGGGAEDDPHVVTLHLALLVVVVLHAQHHLDVDMIDIVDIVDMISYLTPRCGSARLSSANLSIRSSRLAVFSGTWGGGGQCRHSRGGTFMLQISPESVQMVCPGC